MKCIETISPEQLKKAKTARVYSTNGSGPLTHHLALVDEDGNPIVDEGGNPVQWSGRTYGQFTTNAQFLGQKLGLEVDTDGIIRQ